LNKETMRIEESLNVTFDESLLMPKSSPSVEDDRIIKPLVQNPVRCPSLEVNALEPGYPKSLKEAKGHPIEQVIVSSPKSVLHDKALEDSSSDSNFDADLHLNDEEDNDLKEENRDMLSSINKAIKLMLAIATNMNCVIENDIGKEESKDNLNE
ncbi:hypothetical protein Tco_0649204, partial [Tanacetum coccineum]